MREEDELLEREVVKPSNEIAAANGWLGVRILPSNKNGWPDWLYVRLGFYVWVEYKRPGEEPTRQQRLRHEELRDQGCIVYVVDNVKDAHVIFGL